MKNIPIKLVLCFLAFLIWNCEPDSNHSEILEETNQVKEVQADYALSQINNSKTYLNQRKSKDFDHIISQINKEKLARTFQSEEKTSHFTFSLQKEKSRLKNADNEELYYSDNLFVNIDSLNQISYQVFRYIPTKEWLNDTTSNLSTYFGKVQLLSANKNILASTEIENGVQIKKASKAKTEVGECTLVNRVTMCTGSVYPGYETYCTTTYDMYCPRGGGITYSDPTPGIPGDGDLGGGDGDGGGEDDSGSSTSGSPIIKEERPECTGGKINSVVYPFACVCPVGKVEDENGICVEEESPCDKIKSLETDSEFKNKLINLENNLSLDYETGFLMNHNGSPYDPLAGDPGSDEINFNVNGTIDGFLHTHVMPNGNSIFSTDDIRALYLLYDNGYINNTATFVMSVVTGHETSYTIIIDDENAFNTFGQSNLNSLTNFTSFSNYYNNNYLTNTFVGLDEINAREVALLIALEDSGLSLLKANSDYSDWQKIEAQERESVEVDCN